MACHSLDLLTLRETAVSEFFILEDEEDEALKRSKYNARRVRKDGYTFDSQAEALRYDELRLLEKSGEISLLIVHPRFEIVAPVVYKGKRHRAISYVADFQYLDHAIDQTVIEDVKGYYTALFKLKWQLMLLHYSKYFDLRIVEV